MPRAALGVDELPMVNPPPKAVNTPSAMTTSPAMSVTVDRWTVSSDPTAPTPAPSGTSTAAIPR